MGQRYRNRRLTFRALANPSGIANLPASLTINSITCTPLFRYKGGDADATNWDHWDYGGILSITNYGTDPTYNWGSPGLGTNDDSVLYNNGDFYRDTANSYGSIGTEDYCIEVVYFHHYDGTNNYLVMGGTDVNTFYYLVISSATGLGLYAKDGVTSKTCSITVQNDCWHHIMFFVNRSENSNDGARGYINGVVDAGAGANFSTVGSMAGAKLALGGNIVGSGNALEQSAISYIAVWKYADWFQEGAAGPTEWATIAKERAARYFGVYPQKALDTAVPSTMTRAAHSYIKKYNDSTSKYEYRQISNNWVGMHRIKDANNMIVNCVQPQAQRTNLITYSEAFTNWTKVDAGDTVADNATAAPTKRTIAASLVSDADDGQHGVYLAPTLVAKRSAFSVWAKPGNNSWIKLEDTTVANCYSYFDVTNGALGTKGAGCTTAAIDGPYYGDFYRCQIIFTATAAAHTLRILSCSADNDDTFAGDGAAINCYLWGAQCESENYVNCASQLIYTAGASATRTMEILKYVATNNIGGDSAGKYIFKVMACETSIPNTEASNNILYIQDDSVADEYIYMLIYAGTGSNINQKYYLNVTDSGVNQANCAAMTATASDNKFHAIKARIKTNYCDIWFDHSMVGGGTGADQPDTNCTIPTGLDGLYLYNIAGDTYIGNIIVIGDMITGR